MIVVMLNFIQYSLICYLNFCLDALYDNFNGLAVCMVFAFNLGAFLSL